MKILIFGSTGLVGSGFVSQFKDKYHFISAGRSFCDIKLDLTDQRKVREIISQTDVSAVVNFAAYTKVDEAQKQFGDKKGECFLLNVMFPAWCSEACLKSGKRFYHLSTDYVFDGQNIDRPYLETDEPEPVQSWYCRTKREGEKKIIEVFGPKGGFAIIRISYPYSATYSKKWDIARLVAERLRSKQPYPGITDQKIKPTNVYEIAKALDLLIGKKADGIYHAAGSFENGFISPFEFAKEIARHLRLDESLIKPVTFKDFSKSRASVRPRHTWLDTGKIESLGMKFLSEDQSLRKFASLI